MTTLSKTRGIYSATTGRARQIFADTKAKVDEMSVDRRRRSLYCELGQELYRQRATRDEEPELLDRLIDQLQELQSEGAGQHHHTPRVGDRE